MVPESLFAMFLLTLAAGCYGPRARSSVADTVSAEPTVHTYRTVDGVALRAFVFVPTRDLRNPSPAILLFHGGGWVAGSPDWVFTAAKRFAALGFVAIPIQYRLSNANVSPVDAFADACAAFKWVRHESTALRVAPSRIAAYGVSAGGHLAALAATVGCGVSEGAYGAGGPDALVTRFERVIVFRTLSGYASELQVTPVEIST